MAFLSTRNPSLSRLRIRRRDKRREECFRLPKNYIKLIDQLPYLPIHKSSKKIHKPNTKPP